MNAAKKSDTSDGFVRSTGMKRGELRVSEHLELVGHILSIMSRNWRWLVHESGIGNLQVVVGRIELNKHFGEEAGDAKRLGRNAALRESD